MTRTIVHVGLPHTATTTLQEHVFPALKDVRYCGGPYGDSETGVAMNHLCLLESHEVAKIGAVEKLRKAFQIGETKDHRPLLVSEEALTGTPADPISPIGLVSREERVQRLRQLFGPISIVITIRNQIDILRSHYSMELRSCLRAGTDYLPFQNFIAHNLARPYSSLLRCYDYDVVHGLYADEFGTDNVKILLFEDFKESADAWLRDFCEFAGLSFDETAVAATRKQMNPTISNRMTKYEKIRQKIPLPRGISSFLPDGPVHQFMKFMKDGKRERFEYGDHLDQVVERFAEGNRRLATELALPLEDRGYPF